MASRRALTGGTKDLNPQFLRGTVTESAANTFTEAEITVPVMRIGMSAMKAQVIEILYILWLHAPGAIGAADVVNFQLTTSSQTGNIAPNDPDCIFRFSAITSFTTSGHSVNTTSGRVELHDGAGHGIIIASPSIFLGIAGASQATALNAQVQIAYRFKNVSLTEFVGLSIQQSG